MVSLVLGTLLLVTAGLKAHGLYTDPYSQESILLSPRMLVAVIEVEVLLGLWLVSGYARRAACVAALAFFGLATAGSMYLALEGQRSCGCFGRVEVSPWLSLTLDVAAVAALLIWRPVRAEERRSAPWLRGLLGTAGGAVAFLVLIGGALLLACDDPQKALAQLRGEALTVEPPVTEAGEGSVGEQRTFTVRLRNQTDHTIRVVGGTTSCACVATDDLPISLPPGESQTIEVRFKFSGGTGRFQHRFILYYTEDDETQRVVVARFTGRVTAPPSP